MYTIKRFFDCQVPVNRCNFECDYCTVGQWRKVNGEGPKEYTEFKYPIEHMIKALSKERLGGLVLSIYAEMEKLFYIHNYWNW